MKRLEERRRLIALEEDRILNERGSKKVKKRKAESGGTSKKTKESSGTSSWNSSKTTSAPPPIRSLTPPPGLSASQNDLAKKKKKLMMKKPDGQLKVRVTSQGNKRMTIPDELFPEFCRRIAAGGTSERLRLINQFVEDHPTISARQVTIKFADVTTRDRPGCILTEPPKQKGGGRAFYFYLRPRYYKYLPDDERPDDWERYAEADETLARLDKGSSGTAGLTSESVKSYSGDNTPTQATAGRVGSGYNNSGFDDDGDDTEEDEGVPPKKRSKMS